MKGTEFTSAAYHATEASKSLNIVYWVDFYSPSSRGYHVEQAHEHFIKMATVMGYTVTRNSEPVAEETPT